MAVVSHYRGYIEETHMTETATGPLAGVKIVDMSSVVLGPFATLIFADLGADVVDRGGTKG